MNDTPFKITPELAVDILNRRRWVIMIPLCIALVAGIFLAIKLPRVYEAKTMILVEGQRVPQNYVHSIVTEDTAQRISTISQQIMSRTNLEKIIKDFGLFGKPEFNSMYIEDKVANLRKRISVDVISDARRATEAFTITFRDSSQEDVMRVANGLASYFIDENIKGREFQAVGTSDFLDSQLEEMRIRLEKLEEKIKDYRKTYMGELPEQLDSNLRILDRLQETLNNRQAALRDARQRQSELSNQATARPQSVVVIGGEQRPAERGASLEELKTELETLQSKYTDKHPDIIRVKKQISELEAKARAISPSDLSQGAQVSHLSPQARAQILDAQREANSIEVEIEGIKKQIADYQKRVEVTPRREQELLGLKRDYQNIQTTYDSLLGRKLEADIAVNMERKQKGEQFRIIDPARIPKRPVKPDLKKLFLAVLAAGVASGAGAALLIEFARPSYRKPDEIEDEYELPVLVSIPSLLQPKQIFMKKLNRAASIAFAVVVFGLLSVFGIISISGPEISAETIKRLIGG
jgi:polysaccharide chain length determinant protein (PEP-CTERM system associated)